MPKTSKYRETVHVGDVHVKPQVVEPRNVSALAQLMDQELAAANQHADEMDAVMAAGLFRNECEHEDLMGLEPYMPLTEESIAEDLASPK